jgi:hypothetical protein
MSRGRETQWTLDALAKVQKRKKVSREPGSNSGVQPAAKQRGRRAQVLDVDVGDWRFAADDAVKSSEFDTFGGESEEAGDEPPLIDLSALADRQRTRAIDRIKHKRDRHHKVPMSMDARIAGDLYPLV